jgi:SAM-dependent methyltransferase
VTEPVAANNAWDPGAYDRSFGFVTDLGGELIGLLGPVEGGSVLDIGCGTGHLTAALRREGATRVVGIDASEAMVAAASSAHEGVRFVLGDAQRMSLASLGETAPFDAAFSNAALHWMPRGDLVAAAVRGVLRPGARFAAELGGAGNVAAIDAALRGALSEVGLPPKLLVGNTFPTPGEQAHWLEAAGFRVRELRWFERPTPLPAGLTAADWTRHFRARVWSAVPGELAAALAAGVNRRAAAAGLADGGWHVDYCRLRFLAEALERPRS